MGYLRQKKHYARINLLLNVSLVLLCLTSLCALINNLSYISVFVNQWQFHLYVYMLFICIYALYNRFFLHAAITFVLIFINYTAITSSANLFRNYHSNGAKEVRILYQNGTVNSHDLFEQAQANHADIVSVNNSHLSELNLNHFPEYYLFNDDNDLKQSFIVSRFSSLKAGKLRLSPHFVASFSQFIAMKQPFVLVNLDLRKIGQGELKTAFRNLAQFVTAQDNPVVIIGDFGIPVWHPIFKKFLNKTDLEVKNHVILSNASCRFSPLAVPTINVLAYKNFGLKQLTFLDKEKNHSHPLLIQLNF